MEERLCTFAIVNQAERNSEKNPRRSSRGLMSPSDNISFTTTSLESIAFRRRPEVVWAEALYLAGTDVPSRDPISPLYSSRGRDNAPAQDRIQRRHTVETKALVGGGEELLRCTALCCAVLAKLQLLVQ